MKMMDQVYRGVIFAIRMFGCFVLSIVICAMFTVLGYSVDIGIIFVAICVLEVGDAVRDTLNG